MSAFIAIKFFVLISLKPCLLQLAYDGIGTLIVPIVLGIVAASFCSKAKDTADSPTILPMKAKSEHLNIYYIVHFVYSIYRYIFVG